MKSSKKKFWQNYWSNQTNGLHREQTETFLLKEAQEKLFLLNGGKSILDFGCGSAELLIHYAQFYSYCVGADWSSSMLSHAIKRINNSNLDKKIKLLFADEVDIWNHLYQPDGSVSYFDRITAGQVLQYFDTNQVENFIKNALHFLSEEGKIFLFDIIDSRTYELWMVGLYQEKESSTLSLLFRILILKSKGILRLLTNKPEFCLGNAYSPSYFLEIAKKYQLKVSFVNSMYYEYRYHVIFQKEE